MAFLLLLLLAAPSAQPSLSERILVAEDQRGATDADMTALRQGLRSQDPALRRQAIRAIGRLERPDLMPLISPYLTDANANVRIETVNAIGQLGRGPDGLTGAKGRLLARLKGEETPRVRGAIAATLGRLPFTAAADLKQAEDLIANSLPAGGTQTIAVVNLDEVAGAVEGLEALIRQHKLAATPRTITRLRAAATMEGRAQDGEQLTRIRRLARAALNAAGVAERSLLESGVADPDDEVRRLTMIAARAEIEGREEVLKKGLADREARVRYEALQTWGRAFQKESCAPILAAVRDQNPHVSLLAIDLAGGCAAEGRAASDTLHALAETVTANRNRWHQPAHALVSLAKLAPAEARTLLPLHVSHPVWQVRMYAAAAAGTLGAFDALATLARDPHDNVREAALGELVTHKRPEAVPLAIDALQRPDYQLAMTAARALGVPEAKERAVPALLSALERLTAAKRDTSRDARMAILDRLRDMGWYDGSGATPANLIDALRPYVRDFDPAIASKVAEVLQKWTQQPVAAAPQRLPVPPVSQSQWTRSAGSGCGL